MVIFRWILGILTLLLGGGMALSFVLFIVNGDDGWLKLTRRFRHWVYVTLLFWVNFEVWRTVLLIIINW
jgi:hypothetical protein